mgnify:CR=1 FL=1
MIHPRLAMKLADGSTLAAGSIASTLSLSNGDVFGSVSLSGDRLAVGAHGDDTGASAASLAGAALLPPRALYLRRPDAMEPTGPSGART